MSCTPANIKTFLVSCNVALLFAGLSVFILGVKMKLLLSVLMLIEEPLIGHAIEAIIATGFFISFAGITGLAGACNETIWLIILHLFVLGVIVIMEFALGVTLLIVRKTVENYISSMECNTNCAATLDTLVLDYALPAAGLMLTIIIVEALMIYCALKLCSHIRNAPKVIEPTSSTGIAAQNVRMQRVVSPRLGFSPSSRHAFSLHSDYDSDDVNSLYASQSGMPQFPPRPLSPLPPPHYATLSLEQQLPPSYFEAVPTSSTAVMYIPPRTDEPIGSGASISV